jgi:hypothetical protein
LRGSPRSFATQKRLAQDDNFKLTHYRANFRLAPNPHWMVFLPLCLLCTS